MIAAEHEPFNIQHAEQTIPVFARWFGSWRVSVHRLPFSSAELTGLYDRAAPGWDRTLDRLGYPGAYETLLRKALSEEGLEGTGARPRVLDCGVGTGALSGALARVAPTPFKLDAIDISPRMLERTSRSLRDTDLEVTLGQGDVRELPYRSDVFDLVMTGYVLEHLADPSVALNEMVRVLKPGGLLIACLTSRSAFGMIVHLMWRTHSVTPAQGKRWLLESGLDNAHCLSLDDRSWHKRLSLVCVGRKPHSAKTSSSFESLTKES